jgi:hypothetical protein
MGRLTKNLKGVHASENILPHNEEIYVPSFATTPLRGYACEPEKLQNQVHYYIDLLPLLSSCPTTPLPHYPCQ